jgi:hypothetical protein
MIYMLQNQLPDFSLATKTRAWACVAGKALFACELVTWIDDDCDGVGKTSEVPANIPLIYDVIGLRKGSGYTPMISESAARTAIVTVMYLFESLTFAK